MTLSDVELGHHVREAEPCLSVPGISSLSGRRALLAEGAPWTRERDGIDQSQPRPARQWPLFAVLLNVDGISDDAVFRVLGGDVAPPCERREAAVIIINRTKRRRAAVRRSVCSGRQGRRDQGSSSSNRRWVRTGIWAPEPAALAAHFLYGPSAKC